MSALADQSYMEHAAERDDALPFRVFEQAHRRMKLAQQELADARRELDRAFAQMLQAGYAVRGAELADEVALRAPLPEDKFSVAA